MYPACIFPGLLIAWISLVQRASSTTSALSVTPSTTWYGDDGSWSAISIRVGSPQQWVDVLVSTASSETWVVSPGGCDSSSTCTSKRGGLFDLNKSSTWHTEGVFELGLDAQLGFGGDANYGLDTLEFGTTGATLTNTIIGSLNTTEYWLGFFGLGNIPGNFTTLEIPGPVSALENQSVIPSHSYGYTAGAIYQAKSVPCSLTLGGYDANRFIPHNISFALNAVHQPESWLNSISVASNPSSGKPQNWSSNALQLLAPSDGVYVTIDSSTPFLWLPKRTCERFAQAFGLTYNESLSLYTFDGNTSRHDDLKSWNLNFTFSLSDTSNPSQIVNVSLPYAAFDLQLSYPYIANTSYETGNKYYFPLRHAANETQYVLGRSFLQEAYIITDYERNNFSIYQALHPLASGNTSIVDILKPGTSMPPPPQSTSKPPSTPIIIGIAIGAVALLLLFALAIFLYRRHRTHQFRHAITLEPKHDPSLAPHTTSSGSIAPLSPHATTPKPLSPSLGLTSPSPGVISAITPTAYEADSTPITSRRPSYAAEVSADASHQRFELPAPYGWPEELDGRSVTSFHSRGDGGGGEKFAAGQGWDEENASGAKCRASMKVRKGEREKEAATAPAPAPVVEAQAQDAAARNRPRFSWENGSLGGAV